MSDTNRIAINKIVRDGYILFFSISEKDHAYLMCVSPMYTSTFYYIRIISKWNNNGFFFGHCCCPQFACIVLWQPRHLFGCGFALFRVPLCIKCFWFLNANVFIRFNQRLCGEVCLSFSYPSWPVVIFPHCFGQIISDFMVLAFFLAASLFDSSKACFCYFETR